LTIGLTLPVTFIKRKTILVLASAKPDAKFGLPRDTTKYARLYVSRITYLENIKTVAEQ
jgi:hypothetical protein